MEFLPGKIGPNFANRGVSTGAGPKIVGYSLDPAANPTEPDLKEMVVRYTKKLSNGDASVCGFCGTKLKTIGRILTAVRADSTDSMSGIICPNYIAAEEDALKAFAERVIPDLLFTTSTSTRH
jgi:hypothetical protein